MVRHVLRYVVGEKQSFHFLGLIVLIEKLAKTPGEKQNQLRNLRTGDPLRLRSEQALVPLVKPRDFGKTPEVRDVEDFQIEALPNAEWVHRWYGLW
ncbi:MAG: hypothetical protein WBM24_16450 [Candidatus Sulfotelmatobacter sp.]